MENIEATSVSYDALKEPYKAKMLTTKDNPYNPFDQFDEWYQYDTEVLNYNTCALISRFIDKEFGLKGFDSSNQNEELNQVVDKIANIDPLDQYIVVVKELVPDFLQSSNV